MNQQIDNALGGYEKEQIVDNNTNEDTYEITVKGCGVAILKNISQEHARQIINLMMLLSIQDAKEEQFMANMEANNDE